MPRAAPASPPPSRFPASPVPGTPAAPQNAPPAFRWLAILNELAVQGKHIDLVPQKRVEERRTTVTGRGRKLGVRCKVRAWSFGNGRTSQSANTADRPNARRYGAG